MTGHGRGFPHAANAGAIRDQASKPRCQGPLESGEGDGSVLLDDRLVRDATTVQIVEAETPGIRYAYGYGFEIQDYLGLTSVGHAGGMEGVSERYAFYPEQDRLVVVLSNYDTARPPSGWFF